MSFQTWIIVVGGIVTIVLGVLGILERFGIKPRPVSMAAGGRRTLAERVRRPALILFLANLLLTLYGYFNYKPYKFAWKGTPEIDFQQVLDRHFTNERVPLDGMRYRHCTFENVTFVYQGTDSGIIEDAHLTGVNYYSDNPSILAYVSLLKQMGHLPRLTIVDRDGVPIAGYNNEVPHVQYPAPTVGPR
jgi:hypothetical protein